MIVSFPAFEKTGRHGYKKEKKIHEGGRNTAFIDVLRLHGSCRVTNRPFWADKDSCDALTLNFVLLITSE